MNAKTVAHEVIHAEMFRKLLSISQHSSIQLTRSQIIQLSNNFPGLYDYYMRWKWNVAPSQSPSSAQHEAMAQHYRNIIKATLKEFDNTQTKDVYDALSWTGLMGTGTFDQTTGLYSNSTVAWSSLTKQQRLDILNKIKVFNSKNDNCN
ncbi:hypothetical protein ACQY1Q_16965 [Tenacibaculum sp. TC6]|uniref:hypothetical protein n=1 Tax=Tenacibaculum sp. TC6 TaxID=3423223 RepID=UPI003D35C502